MKHVDTYAYSVARDWLYNDAVLQNMVDSLCRQAWNNGWSDSRIERKLCGAARVCGFLGFGNPPISNRSIACWAHEEWDGFRGYKCRG